VGTSDEPPAEPLLVFSLACSKHNYALLRALFARPATAKDLADVRGVTEQAISQQLGALRSAGMVVSGALVNGAAPYELTENGRAVFELVSGLSSDDSRLAGWLVSTSIGDAELSAVRRVLEDSGGQTFACAGDTDYISSFQDEGHQLALALVSALRDLGASPTRTFVVGRDDGERVSAA
jgi:predicted ArsR family transcriptional regulator